MNSELRSEQGSVLLSMLAIVVIGGMIAATFSLVRQSQVTTQRNRAHTAAIQVAEAAVQQAYTYFSTHEDPDPNDDGTVTPAELGLTTDAADNGDFTWTATRSGFDWEIRAQGNVNGVARTVEVTLTRGVEFLLAAFGDTLIDLNGGNLVESYNSATGATGTGNGNVGSNGLINFKGNASSDAVFVYGGSFDDGSRCTGNCPNMTGYSIAKTFDVSALESAILAEANAVCPSGAVDGIYEASVDGDLTPGGGNGVNGAYCFDEMVFDATMNIVGGSDQDNPVIAYVLTNGIVSSGNHMDINCPSCRTAGIRNTHEAGGFRVNVVNGNVGMANQTSYGMTLTAPGAACSKSSGGGQTTFYGSMLCGSVDMKGGFNLYFDDNAANNGSGLYNIANYREEVGDSTSF